MAAITTCDLCDAYSAELQIAEPLLRNFGGRTVFHGPIATLRLFEDNTMVRSALEQPGNGHILVVDGGGSRRCALLGDQLAELGRHHGWAGAVIYGCIRDSAILATMDFGVKALDAHPLRSAKRGQGASDVAVRFAGVTFNSGDYLYADADGLVVATRPLHHPDPSLAPEPRA